MRKVLARGRVLGNSNSEFARMLESDGDVKTFTLKSGKQAKFVKTVVLSGEIESKTFVDSSVNGRDQAMLSPESVSDISRTIKLQQFFPAIGREVNGRIEIWTAHVAGQPAFITMLNSKYLLQRTILNCQMHDNWQKTYKPHVSIACVSWENDSKLRMEPV